MFPGDRSAGRSAVPTTAATHLLMASTQPSVPAAAELGEVISPIVDEDGSRFIKARLMHEGSRTRHGGAPWHDMVTSQKQIPGIGIDAWVDAWLSYRMGHVLG
jgi:hypothetical protein